VKVLVLAQNYPYLGHPLAAPFNERSVNALRDLCDGLEVLVPRPYAPPVLSALMPRWQVYAQIPAYEMRQGIPVYRPAYPQLPRLGGAFWVDQAAFWWCRWTAMQMHRRMRFDVLLAFDLIGVGGLAWRLGRTLGLPAAGWATGNVPASLSYEKAIARALQNLDIVFYQSQELLDKAARLPGVAQSALPVERHLVLPRGIPTPPLLSTAKLRQQIRRAWGIPERQVLVLSIGRIYRSKGIFELIDATALAVAKNPHISCVLVGAMPALDETDKVYKTLEEMPELRRHITLIPACPPEKVWEYLCAADLFAFTSHEEGMPNSLLEALAMGVSAVAFAIPPVVEIAASAEGVLLVPPQDVTGLAEALVRLAAAPDERARRGAIGKNQVLERFMMHKNIAIALDRLTDLVHMKNARHYSAQLFPGRD
jgi:teichuronic acid biosynthesis glycosyltransferase TuaC